MSLAILDEALECSVNRVVLPTFQRGNDLRTYQFLLTFSNDLYVMPRILSPTGWLMGDFVGPADGGLSLTRAPFEKPR
jgi:hypothetical protein